MNLSKQHSFPLYGALSILGLLGVLPASRAGAQIIPDTTLGVEATTVIQDALIRGQEADLIDGGALRGSNLFHSFLEFNVGETQRVYFANPTGVENILSRVTGLNGSDIMGTLGVDGSANLFLLNSNGIVFGPNAQLDISGSFLASTADSFTFADGSQFSATTPQSPELLSVNVPLGVQWGPEAARGIRNEGDLTIGQDLTLSGGNVASTGLLSALSGNLLVESVDGDTQIQDAIAKTATFSASNNLVLQESQLYTLGGLSLLAGDTVQVRDSEANPFVAYAGGDLDIQGNQNIDIFALNHPSSGLTAGQDIVLRSANAVSGDAHYWTGGSFRIEQLNGDLGKLFSPYDPVIRAAGDVEFDSYTGASLHIFAGGSVIIRGIVEITGSDQVNGLSDTVPLSNPIGLPATQRSDVEINGSLRPTLDIRAGTTEFGTPGIAPLPSIPGLVPFPHTASDVATSANIFIGGIRVIGVNDSVFPSSQILLTNQYFPDNQLPGIIRVEGDVSVGFSPGNVSILAPSASVIMDSRGDIGVQRGIETSRGDNNGGSITLLSQGTIRTTDSVTTGSNQGSGGPITFHAVGNIVTDSIRSDSNSHNNIFTNNGDIEIISRAGSIHTRGSVISSTNNGNSGDIVLDAFGNIKTGTDESIGVFGAISQGVSISSRVSSVDENSPTISGNAGNIVLRSRNGSINTTVEAQGRSFESQVSSLSDQGQAGSVSLRAPLDISIGDVLATSRSNSLGLEDINQVSISSILGSVSLDNATVRADNLGEGFAGDVFIFAGDEIRAIDSAISSNGSFGITFITADSLFLERSNISTVSSGSGERSGLIDIEVSGTLLRLEDNSRITAQAANRPDGGEINISVPNGFILARPNSDSDIVASSQQGEGGRINVRAFAIFGVEERPDETVFSDFVARSESNVDGEIVLDTLGIDPSRGLAELPIDVVDISGLVATGCVGGDRSGVEDQGEFSVTGRGGVAQGPTEAIAPAGSPANLATLDDETPDDRPTPLPPLDTALIEPLEEAQGLVKDAAGRVTIAAQGMATPVSPASAAALNCNAL